MVWLCREVCGPGLSTGYVGQASLRVRETVGLLARHNPVNGLALIPTGCRPHCADASSFRHACPSTLPHASVYHSAQKIPPKNFGGFDDH